MTRFPCLVQCYGNHYVVYNDGQLVNLIAFLERGDRVNAAQFIPEVFQQMGRRRPRKART